MSRVRVPGDDDSPPDKVEQRVPVYQRALAIQEYREHLHRLRLRVQQDATAGEACISRLKLELVELVCQSANLGLESGAIGASSRAVLFMLSGPPGPGE
jgi:hypothetical protein